MQKSTWFFFQTLRCWKNAMVPFLFLIWTQGKLAWFRFCIRHKTEPTKNAMVPFLVPFRTGIMVPKVDQLFVHFLIELINSSWSRKTAKSLINCCGAYLCVWASAGPIQLMNFNFSLKNQFWSYEHPKSFVVTRNMSMWLIETL